MQQIVIQLENWIDKQSVQKKLVYIAFSVVFVLTFLLNYFYPIYCDDMLYRVVKFQETVDLPKNFSEIFEFLHFYYFNWGGRIIAHLVAHLLLLFSPHSQDLINSLGYCLLIYICYRIVRLNRENSIFLFVFIATTVFYFTPRFLSSTVWITGSSNYMWTTLIALSLIYAYSSCYNNKKQNKSLLRAILFLFWGIVAGWTNENLGPTLFLLIGVYIGLIYFSQEKKVPLWCLSGIIGIAIGCCLLILAPGNAVRAETEGYTGLFNSFGLITDRLSYLRITYVAFLVVPIIVYFILLWGNVRFARHEEKKKTIILESLLFFITANLSVLITLLSPTFPTRALFYTTVLMVLALAMLYANIDFKRMIPRVINILFLTVILLLSSKNYITYLRGLQYWNKVFFEREKIIEECKAKGYNTVALEMIHLDFQFEYADLDGFYELYYKITPVFLEKGDPRLEQKDNDK